MEQSNQSKKVLLSVIGVAILVVAVVGVSFAFFNYTRTGGTNTVTTGHIEFSTVNAGVAIENMFPIALNAQGNIENADLVYTDEAIVKISGNTTYNGGIEYKVFATNVVNTVAGQTLPISVKVTHYGFSSSQNATHEYVTGTNSASLLAPTTYDRAVLANNQLLAQGTIPENVNVNEAEIHIRAYLDASKIAITDTLVTDATSENYTNGTTTTWVGDRVRLTTDQWNDIGTAGTPVSFKVTVEAVQSGGRFINNPTS